MKNQFTRPSPILPGNTPGALSPVIPIEYVNTAPVSAVHMNRVPFNLQTRPDALPSRAEEEKATDANKFPKLRGFA